MRSLVFDGVSDFLASAMETLAEAKPDHLRDRVKFVVEASRKVATMLANDGIGEDLLLFANALHQDRYVYTFFAT